MACKPANLKVTPDELRFTVAEGWAFIPPYQYISIDRDGPGIAPMFTIAADDPWVSFEPGSGVPPRRIRIGCRSIGFPAGGYVSAVRVTSSVEVDNPVVPVVLVVTPKDEEKPEPPIEPEVPVEPEPPVEPGPEPDDPELPGEPEKPEKPEPETGEAWWVVLWRGLMALFRWIGGR